MLLDNNLKNVVIEGVVSDQSRELEKRHRKRQAIKPGSKNGCLPPFQSLSERDRDSNMGTNEEDSE